MLTNNDVESDKDPNWPAVRASRSGGRRAHFILAQWLRKWAVELGCLASYSHSTISWLCDLGQVTLPSCALVSSSVKCRSESRLLHKFVMKVK